jgi:tetratricopeptide (TPR) repeat protein
MTDAPAKVALCIGINYTGAAPGIPALRFAENDAQALAALLQERGFQVTALLGAQATHQAIYAELNRMADLPARLTMLYFAGHGLRSNELLDKDRVYFLPYDFDPQDAVLGLALTDLATAFEVQFHAQNAFALFDCCYAGVVAEVAINASDDQREAQWRQAFKQATDPIARGGARPSGNLPEAPVSSGQRALIAACPATALAREFTDLQHGAVTYFALAAWSASNADPYTGQLTDTNLYTYISSRLRERQLPPLARAAQIGDVILDEFPHVIPIPPTPPSWPADCRLIDPAFIAAALARAQLPGAPSMYTRPGFQSFWHIAAGQDVRRGLTDRLLQAIAAVHNRPGMCFQLIVSSGGNGKSVLLLRLQYELAQAGECVLVPAQEGSGLDPLALDAACRAFAKLAPTRRVYLLLDDVYRFNTPLLAVLMNYPIDNLTILATTRYVDFNSDSVLPAPALPLTPAAPNAPPCFDVAYLGDLNDREARDLVEQIRQAGKLQVPQPDALLAQAQTEGVPLLLAVLALTNAEGLDTALDVYVAGRLIEVNNGRDPAVEDREQWEPFMQLYYAIAVCSAGGAYAPQSVLAALTELTPSQVNALLCAGGRRTGMAQGYLRGDCGSTWRTDHQLIAAAVLRRVIPDQSWQAVVIRLLGQLAAAPTPEGAELIGMLLHRYALHPDLLSNDVVAPLDAVLAGGDERSPIIVVSREPAVHVLAAALDDPVIAPALGRMRQAATFSDLLVHYGPAYLYLGRWADAVTAMNAVLANPQLVLIAQARALLIRGIGYYRQGQYALASTDLSRARELQPNDPQTRYSMGILACLQGDRATGFQHLAAVIATNPEYREWARTDPALAGHGSDPAFQALLNPPSGPTPEAAADPTAR